MSTSSVVLLSSRDRILLSAKELFAKNGYENTSTVAIARQAGTSESQLMKHFGSKQGLLFAILDQGWSAILHRAYALSSVPVRSSQVLVDVLESYIVELEQDPEMRTLLVMQSRRPHKDDSGLSLMAGRQQFNSLVENLLKDLKNQGALRSDLSISAIRAALFGVVEGVLFEEVASLMEGRELQYLEGDRRKVLETLVSGLVPETVGTAPSDGRAANWSHAD